MLFDFGVGLYILGHYLGRLFDTAGNVTTLKPASRRTD